MTKQANTELAKILVDGALQFLAGKYGMTVEGVIEEVMNLGGMAHQFAQLIEAGKNASYEILTAAA